MASEYTKIGAKLRELAVPKRATVPDDLSPGDVALRTKLQYLSSPKFDRIYMKAMVKENKARIKRFETEIKKGKDPAIQKFASETLPELQDHFEKAKILYRATTAKSVNLAGAEKKP